MERREEFLRETFGLEIFQILIFLNNPESKRFTILLIKLLWIFGKFLTQLFSPLIFEIRRSFVYAGDDSLKLFLRFEIFMVEFFVMLS